MPYETAWDMPVVVRRWWMKRWEQEDKKEAQLKKRNKGRA